MMTDGNCDGTYKIINPNTSQKRENKTPIVPYFKFKAES